MAQVAARKVCLAIIIHMLISGEDHPKDPTTEPTALIRALTHTDVQWGRPIFRAPRLAVIPVVAITPPDPDGPRTPHVFHR